MADHQVEKVWQGRAVEYTANMQKKRRVQLEKLKRMITRLVPEFVLLIYHFVFAVIAIVLHRAPSRHLVVIGITGTKGKTSTASFVHATLSATGEKTGLLSTTEIRIGNDTSVNKSHMTMPGRGYVQRQLRRMVDAGCKYAVIETPSEGIRQFRVFGVWYDSLIFTNLSPEHLVTHKTFERYRHAKGKLFKQQSSSKQKVLNGEPVKRFIITNADDASSEYFRHLSESSTNEQIAFGFSKKASVQVHNDSNKKENAFSIDGDRYVVPLPGEITVQNAVPAILLAKKYCNASANSINKALASVVLPGRMEEIKEGQSFRVFCDYAHEPLSIKSVHSALKGYAKKEGGKVIMIIGAVGASRWKHNATEIGQVAGKNADIVVVTDVDPFFDDSQQMLNAVISGVKKSAHAQCHAEIDRRKAMQKAFSLASGGDVVIITGKGAEVTMEVKGYSLPWDERSIIREELKKYTKQKERMIQ